MEGLNNWRQLCRSFESKKIVVIGDLILDRYIFGNVERISPEAPVPVLKVKSEEFRLGGAANVAANIEALGGEVYLGGSVGKDVYGNYILKEWGKDSLIQSSESHNTVVKTRVIGQKQQIVRIDREDSIGLNKNCEDTIIQNMEKLEFSSIVVSDYAKGTVSKSLIDRLKKIGKERKVPILVDPKPPNFDIYEGITGITPNSSEAEKITGILVDSDESAIMAARKIKEIFNCDFALVTRGEKGIAAVDSEGGPFIIPVYGHDVYDVTGAGDTVMAVLALGISVGAPLKDALVVANAAASIVVEKVGTSKVFFDELMDRLGFLNPRIG